MDGHRLTDRKTASPVYKQAVGKRGKGARTDSWTRQRSDRQFVSESNQPLDIKWTDTQTDRRGNKKDSESQGLQTGSW